MRWLSRLCSRILNCLFVRKCVGCGRLVDAGQPYAICQDCAKKLAAEGLTVSGSRYFALAVSAVPYVGATQSAMLDFKFHNRRYLGDTFAALLYHRVRDMGFLHKIDLVVCVPMHPSRQRYYNQAAVLAKSFSKMAYLPHDISVLEKLYDLPPLSHMGRHARMQAIHGAFAVRKDADLRGKTVALIDDIFTTGATANECARVLRAHGAKAVYVLTPCFAIDKNYHTRMAGTVNTSRATNL